MQQSKKRKIYYGREDQRTFLERVNMLEGFKHLEVQYFDKELSANDLYYFGTQYIKEDSDDSTIFAPKMYGPINDRYFSQTEAEQINMATAIRFADIEWLKTNPFNAETTDISKMYYNYQLFKHVFVWILPFFPTDERETNRCLCRLLGEMHTINDMFHHFFWYIFPRVLEHFDEVEDSIEFLMEAAVTVNRTDHSWEGEIDDTSTSSLGRRPRPIFQLFWRYAIFHDFQESAFVELFRNMQKREDPQFMEKLWIDWTKELAETRASSLWEDPGRPFRHSPGRIVYRSIRWNLPFHVFMNGNNVRFTPYIARACQTVFGGIPRLLYDIIELQCHYVTRNSKTMRLITELQEKRFVKHSDFVKKLKWMESVNRTDRRIK